ncbi:MAG: hypothetical protein ACW99G_13345, partial [Candidatus Thorarchaeota archaeon]
LALVSLSPLFTYIVIPILPALVIKGAFWKHEPAFTLIHGVYNLHPQVAKVEVERGTPLDDEEMEAVVWGVREWERKKRGDRRWGISTIATLLSWIILLVVSFWFSGLTYYYFFYFASYFPFLGAILIGVLTFLILKRWDGNAMGEVFQETTDSHEPIWMD